MQKVYIFLTPRLLIFLFSLSILFAASNVSIAKSNLIFAKEQPIESVATVSAQNLKYELPYPGLLPDNPLYFLKAIRDRIVSFLISDSLKKAEFNLLQADKRLNAGVYLFNSAKQNDKKIQLAISTISKAENYFEESLQKTKEARGQGTKTTEIINKLTDSSRKHQEVLKSLEEKSPQDFKSSFNLQLQRADKFVKEAMQLTLK